MDKFNTVEPNYMDFSQLQNKALSKLPVIGAANGNLSRDATPLGKKAGTLPNDFIAYPPQGRQLPSKISKNSRNASQGSQDG
jgi:hypothetical protein